MIISFNFSCSNFYWWLGVQVVKHYFSTYRDPGSNLVACISSFFQFLFISFQKETWKFPKLYSFTNFCQIYMGWINELMRKICKSPINGKCCESFWELAENDSFDIQIMQVSSKRDFLGETFHYPSNHSVITYLMLKSMATILRYDFELHG